MKTNETIAVTIKEGTALLRGRTFPLRDRLKDLGARWDGSLNAWVVSPARLPEVRQAAASRNITLIEPTAAHDNQATPPPPTPQAVYTPHPKLLDVLDRIAQALETIAIELLKKGG